jgi:mono/diheme cytochrome c family protein
MTWSTVRVAILLMAVVLLGCAVTSPGRYGWQGLELREAPVRADVRRNPYECDTEAARAGAKLVRRYCAHCHGPTLGGTRRAPALVSSRVRRTPPGDLFWFITNGDLRDGMPAWSRLPAAQRWQVVTYLRASNAPQPGP